MALRFSVSKAPPTLESVEELLPMLLEMGSEIATFPLSVDRIIERVWVALKRGWVFVARDPDGRLLGSLALVEHEEGAWYSDATRTVLRDTWFFVRPEVRKGRVGALLLKAGEEIASEQGRLIVVNVQNPHRPAKLHERWMESELIGWIPMNHTIKKK